MVHKLFASGTEVEVLTDRALVAGANDGADSTAVALDCFVNFSRLYFGSELLLGIETSLQEGLLSSLVNLCLDGSGSTFLQPAGWYMSNFMVRCDDDWRSTRNWLSFDWAGLLMFPSGTNHT